MNATTNRRLLPVLLCTAVCVPLAACGDDTSASPVDDGVLDVVMEDFHYGDLPSEVPVGTRIEVSNDSASELHEFVAFRLDDGEDRPASEIVADDLGAVLGGSEPAAVLLAPPGGEQIAAVGDGTLSEPSRYLIICVVPTGADPAEYLAAAATSAGPPQVDGGPPHAMNGMFAELVVTES